MNQMCINKDLIDIVGLCDPESINLCNDPYWTQISIPEELTIPEQKPDIEQINSVKVRVKILKKKIITTPTSSGKNREGKKLTGKKLIIEGELIQAVTYTADVPEQSIHTAHFVVPFSAFIVIDGDAKPNDIYEVVPCVEDVFILSLSKRKIFKNVTLLLQAVKISGMECTGNC